MLLCAEKLPSLQFRHTRSRESGKLQLESHIASFKERALQSSALEESHPRARASRADNMNIREGE
jgi:hypothetical protein